MIIRESDSDYLFANRLGNSLSTRYIQIMIKDYGKKAGIDKKK